MKKRHLKKLVVLAAFLVCVLTLGLRSMHAQNDVARELDIVYGEADGQKLLLDAFRPAGELKTRPALILVHGGGWAGGDKKDFRDLAVGATRAGYATFSVGYRLVKADANKYPAQIDDVQRAVRWIRANAARFGADPNRIGALGASAGGHLVALLGTRETRDNSVPELSAYSSRVNCVVDMFGPTDFTLANAGLSNEGTSIVLNFFGKTPQEAPELYRDGSPIVHIDHNTVPFLIFHGDADPLVPLNQSERFYDALQKAKIESKLIVFKGEGHGFTQPANQATFIQETLAFFNQHLKP